MPRLERLVALAFLTFCSGYAWLAWNYPLLPFERNMPFKPNTLPMGLSVLGIILSLAVLLQPGHHDHTGSSENLISETGHEHNWIHPLLLIVLMIGYALTLRPLGFIFTTSAFLIIGGVVLGERKLYILVPVALITASTIWYVTQKLLGIYLNPWPLVMGLR